MASALPNAIINKDIFPCKTCGIWFKSERNLQAHLMYYCSGRPRESEQPNTDLQISRTCTYPQCNPSFLEPQTVKMLLSKHTAFNTEETSAGSSMKCTICDFTADTPMALQPHILTHLSQTGLCCSQCRFSFQTPQELAKHQELHRHSGLDSKSTSKKHTERFDSVAGRVEDKSTTGSHVQPNTEQENGKGVQGTGQTEVGCGDKAEPSSPRLASSPVQNHLTQAFPILSFLPHVAFSQDPLVPQASEILAKMSELVHRRLRHGENLGLPPVMYGTLVPKGATCFECNITFSNLDNYLVHKKHYCLQQMSKYGILDKSSASPKTGGGSASLLKAGHSFEVKGTRQINGSLAEAFGAGGKAAEEVSASCEKAASSGDADERPSRVAFDSESLKSESGHNQTTCEACKITFSRNENYIVHKQYYCASRHDPPAKRAANNKHAQKSLRTRKRKKMPWPDPTMSQSYPINSSQNTVERLKDVFNQQYNMIQRLGPKHPEPSLTATKSAPAVGRGEADAPMDLSKKCTVQFGKGLMDYHECVMCKISFGKVKDYLSHKQSSCLGAVLESKAANLVEEPSRDAAAPNGFSFNLERSVHVNNTSASAEKPLPVKDEQGVTMDSNQYPGGAKKIRADEQVWPYYEIKHADYATGTVPLQKERRQSPDGGTGSKNEQLIPDSSRDGSKNINHPKVKSLTSSPHGDANQEMESCSNLVMTPDLLLLPARTSTTKPVDHISSSPASKIDEISGLNSSTSGSGSVAVNGKYCRPCDIRFNNLSNFITHKKFYCSAHTAEHVK